MRTLSLLVFVCLATAQPASAQIYTWRDDSGHLVSSNRPPADVDGGGTSRAETRARYDDLIEHHAASHGLSSDLVRAVIQAESGFNAHARFIQGRDGPDAVDARDRTRAWSERSVSSRTTTSVVEWRISRSCWRGTTMISSSGSRPTTRDQVASNGTAACLPTVRHGTMWRRSWAPSPRPKRRHRLGRSSTGRWRRSTGRLDGAIRTSRLATANTRSWGEDSSTPVLREGSPQSSRRGHRRWFSTDVTLTPGTLVNEPSKNACQEPSSRTLVDEPRGAQ